jgi:hypothetical protein
MLAFTMDYLSGGDLENIQHRDWLLDKKVEVFQEICQAVAFAHRMGVIHRDIKPSNVVMDSDDRPVLTDFDIADIRFVTNLSLVEGLGTPIFAAPEQLLNANTATEQSDIYSLGRLLHFILLDRSPGFALDHDRSLENLSKFPPALVSIVQRATRVEPNDRFATVGEMIRELEEYQTGWAYVRARIRSARRWVRRHVFALLALIAIAGGIIGFILYSHGIAEHSRKMADSEREMADRVKALNKELERYQLDARAMQQRMDKFHADRDQLEKKLADLTAKIKASTTGRARRALEAERDQIKKELADLIAKQTEAQQELDALLRGNKLKADRERIEKAEPNGSLQSAVIGKGGSSSGSGAPTATSPTSPSGPIEPDATVLPSYTSPQPPPSCDNMKCHDWNECCDGTICGACKGMECYCIPVPGRPHCRHEPKSCDSGDDCCSNICINEQCKHPLHDAGLK